MKMLLQQESYIQVSESMCGSEFLLHISRDGTEHTAEGGQAVPASLRRAQRCQTKG